MNPCALAGNNQAATRFQLAGQSHCDLNVVHCLHRVPLTHGQRGPSQDQAGDSAKLRNVGQDRKGKRLVAVHDRTGPIVLAPRRLAYRFQHLFMVVYPAGKFRKLGRLPRTHCGHGVLRFHFSDLRVEARRFLPVFRTEPHPLQQPGTLDVTNLHQRNQQGGRVLVRRNPSIPADKNGSPVELTIRPKRFDKPGCLLRNAVRQPVVRLGSDVVRRQQTANQQTQQQTWQPTLQRTRQPAPERIIAGQASGLGRREGHQGIRL